MDTNRYMKPSTLIYTDPSLKDSALKWANRLSLSCVDGSSASISPKAQQAFIRERCLGEGAAFALVLGTGRLALHAIDPAGGSVDIYADFHGSSTTYRRKKGGGKGQMIAKAVGVKSGPYPSVLDATSGLGKDAFVLASLGCRVTLLERVSVVHALLEDAMERARQFSAAEDLELLEILERMHPVNADALDYMNAESVEERPDVIYLDPMFPQRTKTAQVKKEMQVFQRLLSADASGADALLESALTFARSRIVVKRPRIAPALRGPVPSHKIEGKRNRYDVYVLGN